MVYGAMCYIALRNRVPERPRKTQHLLRATLLFRYSLVIRNMERVSSTVQNEKEPATINVAGSSIDVQARL
jgi:hypothetical protein